MPYNNKSIIKDVNSKPIPQYFNKELDKFEAIESKNGVLGVILYDSQGNEIVSQNLVNQISDKLDELIQVVNKEDGI